MGALHCVLENGADLYVNECPVFPPGSISNRVPNEY